MLQLSSLRTDSLIRIRLTATIACSLALLTASMTEKSRAEDSEAVSNRRIAITCDLKENSPVGTLVTRLLDHHLTLKNFRAAESQVNTVFAVDPSDGSVRIDRNDQINYETNPRLRFLVSADEELAEKDPFLQQFSAGLLEEGLASGAVESISTGTVTFDITVRLRDVPEPPELSDANLLVQVFDDSPAEIGTVASANRQSLEELRYFIISGNEDGIFQINAETGVLSLLETESLNDDMISTHELEIVAENTAGLSATATVIVSAVNETPRFRPLADSAEAYTTEQNSDFSTNDDSMSTASVEFTDCPFEVTLKLYYEPEFRAPLIFAAGDNGRQGLASTGNGSGDSSDPLAYTMIPHLATPILNTGPIDTVELRDWLTTTDDVRTSDVNNGHVISAESSGTTETESEDAAVTKTSVAQGVLQSLIALIIFVASCVAAAIAISRASAARREILDDATVGHAEDVTAQLRNCECEVPELDAEFSASDVQSQRSNAVDQRSEMFDRNSALSEQIGLLQGELAARDQLIAELTARMGVVSPVQATESILTISDASDVEIESQDSDTSNAVHLASELDDSLSSHSGDSLLEILQHVESQARVCSSETVLDDQMSMELTNDNRVPFNSSFNWKTQEESDSEYSSESSPSSVATLNEQDEQDEQDELRSEMAELFAAQKNLKVNPPEPVSEANALLPKEESAEAIQEVTPTDDENSHMDSVKRYLAQLLERSKDSTSPEDVLVDRRKIDSQSAGSDRRSSPAPARKPVKSFLESYMSSHGGELVDPVVTKLIQKAEVGPDLPKPSVKPRAPVDVKSVRESMKSFRAVAIQSVENAVLSHDLPRAKGIIAVRTMMLTGLTTVTAFAFLANVMEVIQFRLLPWVMAAGVVCALIELSMRVQSIRKQRKDLVSDALTSTTRQRKRSFKRDDLDDTIAK